MSSDGKAVEVDERVEAIEKDYDEELQAYYTEAGLDYEVWSQNFHMHFGFWQFGVNPFNRESMLEEMNEQVFDSLSVVEAGRYLDAGCGAGASARQFHGNFPKSELCALSIVPDQIRRAKEMSIEHENLQFHIGDFERCSFEKESFDGAYALESSCHGHGSDKKAFAQEMGRLLKSGGRLVLVDLMLKSRQMPSLLKRLYDKMCRYWAVDEFAVKDELLKSMDEAGFELVYDKDISWRVVPSVLHVPWVVLKFLLLEWRSLFSLNEYRKNNVLAPIYGFFFGLLGRAYLGYYKLVFVKR